MIGHNTGETINFICLVLSKYCLKLNLKKHTETSPGEEETLQQNDPDVEGNEKSEAKGEEAASEITKDDRLIPSEIEVVSELETRTDGCENEISSVTEIPESSSLEEKTDGEEQQSPPEQLKKDIQVGIRKNINLLI